MRSFISIHTAFKLALIACNDSIMMPTLKKTDGTEVSNLTKGKWYTLKVSIQFSERGKWHKQFNHDWHSIPA